MGGSPRVEKAAQIRIENPNLTTEEAMKLAGFSEGEAKDPKRQSNVRQKTHRLAKGRKRSAGDLDLYTPDPKRMSYPTLQDPVYSRMTLHATEQNNVISDYTRLPMDIQFSQQQQHHHHHQPQQQQQQQQQQQRISSVDNFSASRQQYPIHQSVLYPGLDSLPNQSMQQNLIQHTQHTQHTSTPLQQPNNIILHQPQSSHQQYLAPFDSPMTRTGSTIFDSVKSPGGSPRIEMAARVRLEDPSISTKDAMRLVGFTDDEARDKKKQNNVWQKTHRLSLKHAKTNQKPLEDDVSTHIKDQIARLETKLETSLEQLEKQIDEKFKKIDDRIDQKFATIMQLLESIASHRTQQDPPLPARDPVTHIDISDTIQL